VKPGPDGRVHHFKKMSDRLIPVHSMQLRMGALVEITTGQHSSLYGRVSDFKVMEKNDPKSDSICSIKLQLNEEIVQVNHSELQIIDEHALPSDHPALLSSEELQKRRAADVDMLAPILNGNDFKQNGKKKRSKSPEQDSDNDTRPEKKHKSKRSRSRELAAPMKITWVVPQIRVRVINKRLGGGKYYNQKGRVDDVVSVSHFTLIMDSGQLIEQLEEKDVETALPKPGGNVLLVKGEHKGEIGKLLERNASSSTAAIQLESEMEVIKSSFDDIAEHVP